MAPLAPNKDWFNISHLWSVVPTISSVSDAAKSPWRITVRWSRLTQSSRPVSLRGGVSAQVMTAFLVTASSLLCVPWNIITKQVHNHTVISQTFKHLCFLFFFLWTFLCCYKTKMKALSMMYKCINVYFYGQRRINVASHGLGLYSLFLFFLLNICCYCEYAHQPYSNECCQWTFEQRLKKIHNKRCLL